MKYLLAILLLLAGALFGTAFASPWNLPELYWNLRIPRLLGAFCIGGILSSVGFVYQTLFSNPLAEPYSLGVSSLVALLTVALELYLGVLSPSWYHLLGISLSGAAFLWALSRTRLGSSAERLILVGTGINFFLSSLLLLLLILSQRPLGGAGVRWLFGRIPWWSWPEVGFVILLSALWFLALRRKAPSLEAMGLGDLVAKTLGVEVRWNRAFWILTSSFLIGCIVPKVGSIGFVGLVIPQLVRRLTLLHFPLQLEQSFLWGGVFLAFCDLLSRVIYPPFEIPIGILTTLVGGPLFIYFLVRESWRS